MSQGGDIWHLICEKHLSELCHVYYNSVITFFFSFQGRFTA